MKKTLLFAAALVASSTAIAQDYHGFSIDASQELIDNVMGQLLSSPGAYRLEEKAITLQVLYQPKYTPIIVSDDLTTWAQGSTVYGSPLVDYASPKTSGKDQVDVKEALANGKIDGAVLKSEMDPNGLAYVTIPAQYYKGGELVDVPAEGGDIRVRFCTESTSKSRLGDDARCYVKDITGVYVTVDAPSTVTITSDFIQGNTTTKFNVDGATGTTDELGGIQRCARFPLPSTAGNGPQDISYTGKAKGSYNLFDYKRPDKTDKKGKVTEQDVYGFPLRYIDIVFYGVKPGERIGWTNYQSLHDGYTPKAVAGVETIGVDNNADAPVEYFNLQGMRVENPANGIYIRRQGTEVTKVVIRN